MNKKYNPNCAFSAHCDNKSDDWEIINCSTCFWREKVSGGAVEHRVHWTLRLWAWLKNCVGLGLRQ